MPVVKVPESLREDLASIGLVVWSVMHPMEFGYTIGGSAGRGRHDKTRVMVQLSGPGLADASPWGYGGDIRGAVNDALSHPEVIGRVTGLKGAMMRLEREMYALQRAMQWAAYREGGEQADEIPF